VQELVAAGKAYRCYCSSEELDAKREIAMKTGGKPKYDGTCRERSDQPSNQPFVVRFRSPQEGETSFHDRIKGQITFRNDELDDVIIQRSDGTPTYNFVVVVDDALMGMTLIIRGDDHVNNTPRQILMYQALGYPVPEFAHVPMILGADKSRLSKRHGATSVMVYREMGFLPEAMVNYLVRLGWSHGDDEIFSMDDLIQKFTLEGVGRSAGVFNPEKLLWLNAHYIKTGDPVRLGELLQEYLTVEGVVTAGGPDLPTVAKLFQDRSKTMVEMAKDAAFFYRSEVVYDQEAVAKCLTAETKPVLTALVEALEGCAIFDADNIGQAFTVVMAALGLKLGKVAPAVRVAIVGNTVSPSIYDVLAVLGKSETLRRLRGALALIV